MESPLLGCGRTRGEARRRGRRIGRGWRLRWWVDLRPQGWERPFGGAAGNTEVSIASQDACRRVLLDAGLLADRGGGPGGPGGRGAAARLAVARAVAGAGGTAHPDRRAGARAGAPDGDRGEPHPPRARPASAEGFAQPSPLRPPVCGLDAAGGLLRAPRPDPGQPQLPAGGRGTGPALRPPLADTNDRRALAALAAPPGAAALTPVPLPGRRPPQRSLPRPRGHDVGAAPRRLSRFASRLSGMPNSCS